MVDPHTLHLDGPTQPWSSVRDRDHCPACLGALPPDNPDACPVCDRTYAGPAVPVDCLSVAALERRRLAERGVRPQTTLPGGLAFRADAAGEVRVEPLPHSGALPPDTPITTDHIGDEEWGRQQIVTMRQATFTPTGPPHFPVPSLSEAPLAEMVPPGMTLWVQLPDGRRQVTGQPRRSWWRRIWRRRG